MPYRFFVVQQSMFISFCHPQASHLDILLPLHERLHTPSEPLTQSLAHVAQHDRINAGIWMWAMKTIAPLLTLSLNDTAEPRLFATAKPASASAAVKSTHLVVLASVRGACILVNTVKEALTTARRF